MWRSNVPYRVTISLALCLAAGASACATSRGTRTGETSEPTPFCVVTDLEWAGLSVKQCYLESAPTSLPQDARIPFVATATRTPIGSISNPLTIRVGEEDGRGRVVTFGEPVPADEEVPDPLDELDAMRREMESRQSSVIPFDEFEDVEGEGTLEESGPESSTGD